MIAWVLTALVASAGPDRVRWDVDEHRRFHLSVIRGTTFQGTPVADDEGGRRYATELELALVIDCAGARMRSRTIELTCSVEDAGLRVVSAPEDVGTWESTLAHMEGRIEASQLQVTLRPNGRLVWVRAREQGGVLWKEVEGLSAWVARALSPLDVRLRERDDAWKMRYPAAGRIFGNEPVRGASMEVRQVAPGITEQTGVGTWLGTTGIRARLTSKQRYDGEDGCIVAARADVRGYNPDSFETAEPIYWMHAEVRYLGDLGVPPLISAEVQGIVSP